ncbi:unnamed protein product [Effrenium voratum]|nr:unnamed protein product [Effrenium voratum]
MARLISLAVGDRKETTREGKETGKGCVDGKAAIIHILFLAAFTHITFLPHSSISLLSLTSEHEEEKGEEMGPVLTLSSRFLAVKHGLEGQGEETAKRKEMIER